MFIRKSPRVDITIQTERMVKEMARILWIILAVIIVVWLVGFLMDVAGGLIHILLVIGAIILVINLISGRKGV
jgi:hypothetical protein